MEAEANKPNTANLPLAIAAGLIALVAAAGVWAMLGYVFAWKLGMSLGMILPPLGAGGIGGLIMRFGGRGFGQRIGWVSLVFVLIGCVIGDIAWIMLVKVDQNLPPLDVLGPELDKTIRALLDLFKLFMYAIACYLTYAISSTQRATNTN